MFGVSLEAAIDRMTRITDRYFGYEEVNEKIHQGRKSKRTHGKHRPAACKIVNTDGNPKTHNEQPKLPVEIFLDI